MIEPDEPVAGSTWGHSEEARRPLSFPQQQLWFLDQLAPGQATYNILMIWRLCGPLRVDLLQRCLDLLVARHEALRLIIRDDDGTPYQTVTAAAPVRLGLADLRELTPAEREDRVQEEIASQRAEPYALRTGPLYRFRLLRLAAEEYVFLQGFSHLVCDGWSTALVNTELGAAYRSLHSGIEPSFEDLPVTYTEYARAQRDRLCGSALAEGLAFFQEGLAGLPRLDLPADRPRPVGGKHRGSTRTDVVPDDIRELAQRVAREHGVSIFAVLTTALGVVLGRYTGLRDIAIGIPMLGRPDPELETLVGMFVNMVVLRSDFSDDPRFADLLARTGDSLLDLYDYQEVPFNSVVEAVQPTRDPDRNPLFSVSIQFLAGADSGDNLDLPGIRAELVRPDSVTSRFDIAATVYDTDSTLQFITEYSCDLFDDWRLEGMHRHLFTVLAAAAADPDQRVSALPLVAGAEAEQLLAAGAATHLEAGLGVGRCFVVDPALNLVPPGIPGELVVDVPSNRPDTPTGGSDAVANFVRLPFAPGQDAYRTGRLARWSNDLRLEFLDQEVSELPLTEAGAVGRYVEPSTPTEQVVTDIVGELLSLPQVGADDSFFDIGGNSLQAMRAIARMNKTFGVKLSVRALYGNASMRAVAASIDQKLAGSVG